MNEKVTLIDRKYKLKQQLDILDKMCDHFEAELQAIEDIVIPIYQVVAYYNLNTIDDRLNKQLLLNGDTLRG